MKKYSREVEICKSFYENKVCGVIVSQAKDTNQYEHFQRLIDHGVPLVFYDRICTGVNSSRVVVDDYMGAYTAVNYLIGTGCRRIAFYGASMKLEITKNRFNGYHDALVNNNIQPEERFIKYCDNRADAEIITPALLSEPDRPDAFSPSTTTLQSAFSIPPSTWDCVFPMMLVSVDSLMGIGLLRVTLCLRRLNSAEWLSEKKPQTSLLALLRVRFLRKRLRNA